MQFKFAWSQMPAELRPQSKRKAATKPSKAKRVKIIPTEVVEQKLKILEQKEKENPEGDERSVKGENESDEDLENVRNFDLILEENLFSILLFQEEEKMEDQEMDDDIDYGNNYFDNGEGYNEEDDNLDEGGDGPIY